LLHPKINIGYSTFVWHLNLLFSRNQELIVWYS